MTRSVVVETPGRSRLASADPPEPGSGEALIRITAAGLCGSDRELFDGSRPAGFAAYPITPGHEWSGTVAAVGDQADRALLGAPVVGEGFRGCMVCGPCRNGAPNLCLTGYDETGFTRPGAFSDHLVLPSRLLHVLSPGADLRAAALLEPAAVVASAVRHAVLRPGETAAVVGAGTLGVLALQLLSAASPAELAAIDPRRERGATAIAAGATVFLSPGEARGGAYDVVVETAGAAGTAHAAVALTRRGGRAIVTGIPGDASDTVPTALLVTKALTLHTVFGAGPPDWAYAVRAFESGVLRPSALITHELPLARFEEALKLSAAPGAGKVLLRPDLD